MKHFFLTVFLCCGLARLPAADSVVVFSEINYHPATNETANEWVELHNQMAIDIDLSAWFLQGTVEYVFAEGTLIPGGGYLVIATDPATVQLQAGIANVLGPLIGRLNNAEGRIELRDRNDRLMDFVEYSDGGKWPVAPDGSGATLAKRHPNLTSEAPGNWASSIAVGGTPGAANFPTATLAQRRTLVPLNSLWRFESSGTDLGAAWREPDYDESGWSGLNEANLVSYWPFDGNANALRGVDGSLVGGIATTTDRNGAPGGALQFNGASQQYVSVPGGGGLNGAAAGTVSLWVRWTGTQDADCCGGFGAVLARQANGLFSDNILALNSANPASARVVWRQSGGPAPVLITGTTLVGGDWHHIAVTFSSQGTILYINGNPEGAAVGGALNNNPAFPLSIGAWAGDGAGFATGAIDDVAIWDRPLSPSQIAQIAAQTRQPLDYAASESAIYFAGDGRLSENDALRQTLLPLGPTTYYFRQAFLFGDDPARAALTLDLAADDGAVFYLNGSEIHRHNMPAGAITYSTLAAMEVGEAPITAGIPVPAAALRTGTNLLAVEVHQAIPSDLGMIFGAALNVTISPLPPVEHRSLIALHDEWKFEASATDLGTGWRAPAFNDTAWSSGPALLFAGSAAVDGLDPERIDTVTATASTEYMPDGRLAARVVDGAGLVNDAHVITPGGTMWLNNGTFVLPNDLDPFITFDIGSAQPLLFMKVWNYNETLPNRPELLARGVSRADILAGLTADALNPLILGQSFAQAPGTQTDFSQMIDLGNISARYVKFEHLTNFPGGDHNFVGLSEVQFFREADLKRTEVPLGAVTYYFRRSFEFLADPTLATLKLRTVFDDGAVFYLNGIEIYRMNMPSGEVGYDTRASSTIPNATFTGTIDLPAGSLVRGANVLAVEIHQTAGSADTDMIFGATLEAELTPRAPVELTPATLVFNEVSPAGATPFLVELVNRGAAPVDVSGYLLQQKGPGSDAEFALISQVISPGQFLALNLTALGLDPAAGDKLFLFAPNRATVADAVQVRSEAQARHPDGGEEWFGPDQATFGAGNTVSFQDAIVINEIMYHAPPALEVLATIGTNTLITFTNAWRYEQSGTDLGEAWRMPGYDDSAWPIGEGLFYLTAANLPAPKNTPLNLGPTTYYFRTTFDYTGTPAILSMLLRHIVDDGVVFYLNGREIARFNIPAGVPGYSTNSISAILNASLRTGGAVSVTNLVIGPNVFAAEVHQAANPGGDAAFGAEVVTTIEATPSSPYTRSSEHWIELFNRGSNPVDLTGWRLDEGIDYRFPSNTTIAPGGYLVVAKAPDALRAKFPGLDPIGPYNNNLSRRGERVVLKDATDNPADMVAYFDDGRWPGAPDGGGSSLELRDPRADNSAGEAWAASDEAGRSSWQTYSYRGTAQASAVGPDGQWREFIIGLLDAGEVWLDDVSVLETPGGTPVELIQNGTFTSGLSSWRIIGNHHGDVIDDPDSAGNKILRLRATGATEHMSNHGETTLAGGRDLVNGREYLISFRAKWISGSRLLNTRLYFNRLPQTTILDSSTLRGTPGSLNSTFTPNIGPTYSSLRHDPAVPAPFAPVTVSLRAEDPDAVAGLALWSAVDGQSWTSRPMINDAGRYTASLPGLPAGTVVQFYIQGTDQLGAQSFFPAAGPDSRALYQVDDDLAATNGLHNIRLIARMVDTAELFRTVNLMSNGRIGSTMIYGEQEIYYDVGLRLKGSEHSRTTTARLGFNVAFTSEQLFRGIHNTIALDRSESTGFGQREMLVNQTLNHAGGVPTKYHDLGHIIAPRSAYTGSAEIQMGRYTDVFFEDQYPNDAEGTVYEYELVYHLDATDTGMPEGNKIPSPGSTTGTAIRNLGDNKENYRWSYLIKNFEERDDYRQIIAFSKTMELTGAAFITQITNLIEPEQWLRAIAVNVLSGAGDSYGGDGSAHNAQFYVRPSDGRVLYLPHDMDAFFMANRPIIPNPDMNKMIASPVLARTYYGHLLDIIDTTYNGNYMSHWAAHFGRLLPAQNFAGHLAFINQRVTSVTSQLNAAVPNVPFAITSNGGNDFDTAMNLLTLTGTAPIEVKTIQVDGIAYPINWTSLTAWSIMVPLRQGANSLSVQGVAINGEPLSEALDTITINNTSSGAPLPVVINEWMADNAGPSGFPDPLDGLFQDWIELFNPNPTSLDLAGFYLTDNPSQPTKWQFPAASVIPANGFMLVWADNQPEQNTIRVDNQLHAAFQLNRDGESIALYSPAGVLQHAVTFGPQMENVSLGLFPDGNTNAFHFMPDWTPAAPNTIIQPPRFTEIRREGSGSVTLRWTTQPGRMYQVEVKHAFQSPAWTPLGPPIMAETDSITAVDAISLDEQRFYRIRED